MPTSSHPSSATGVAAASWATTGARDGFDAVIAAGGDGTVSAVASALASAGEGAVPLGVIAIGTLNHFAKDLGLPLRPGDAARVA